jgi:hypothetical protein
LRHLDISAVEHGDERRTYQIVIVYYQNSWLLRIRHFGTNLRANSGPW